MSEDEGVLMAVFGITSCIMWGMWLWRTLAIDRTFGAQPQRQVLLMAPLLCVVALFVVLRAWASHDVRDSPLYLAFYVLMGTTWVGFATLAIFPWMGLHYVHDAVERGNLPAAVGISGGLLGYTLAFAGGNIGDGPGWWVVLFSAGLSTLTMTVAWLLTSLLANMAEQISIERDLATGVRLAGFLIAAGMVCGRGAAGDWVSAEATVVDFLQVAWMVGPLLGIAVAFDRLGRPTPETPQPSIALFGVLPTLLSIGLAAGWIVAQGAW